ncbi:MAG: RusA family crossover junction endodeoxyribonuclease [Comamonas sp.]|nr:RusA family crossover junction endodeoxyribonuclease [Comamonas sp.]
MIGYSLTLPMGPSINSYYLRTKTGGVRISDKGQIFRAEVHNAVVRSKMPKLTGRLCVVMRIFPSTKRLQDISNRIKAAEDALQHAGAFVNDEQIDDLQVTRGPVVPGGRIEVLIGELPCQP